MINLAISTAIVTTLALTFSGALIAIGQPMIAFSGYYSFEHMASIVALSAIGCYLFNLGQIAPINDILEEEDAASVEGEKRNDKHNE